jgi:hypothetical protein
MVMLLWQLSVQSSKFKVESSLRASGGCVVGQEAAGPEKLTRSGDSWSKNTARVARSRQVTAAAAVIGFGRLN